MGHNAKTAASGATILIGLLYLVAPLAAQQEQAVALVPSPEDAPSARYESASSFRETAPAKDDRIFDVMPNFETLEGVRSAPPLSAGEKFKLTADGAFDPFEFALAGLLSGVSQAENDQPSYGQGVAGYGKRYAEAFGNQVVANFMSGAIFPTLLREDPRYFQAGTGKFGHRFSYALSRIFVTPTDAGRLEFNYSEFLGNATAVGIANAYNSPDDRTAANAASNLGEQIAIDMMGNELKEFWPDLRRKHHKENQTNP